MPTSGSLPIRPQVRFFPKVETMFSHWAAWHFQGLHDGDYPCDWDNVTKMLSCPNRDCGTPHIGHGFHVWSADLSAEDWDTCDSCGVLPPPVTFHLPLLDIPTGPGYNATVGDGNLLTLQELFTVLWHQFHTSQGYAFRYGRLWSTVEPQLVLHNFSLIHFWGWPD